MPEGRIASGLPPLDDILGGGFPEYSINLLMGLPGTGKTILAEQILFANAAEGRKAVYFSTISEPLDKILRYVQGFSFYRPELVQDRIFFEDLSPQLRSQDLPGVVEHIASVLRRTEAGFVVIDSLKALRSFFSEEEFRRSLHELALVSTSLPLTSFWIGEYEERETGVLPEFAIADGVIELILQKRGTRDTRYLRVLKMRGTDFRGGEHAFRVARDGLRVFPRLPTVPPTHDYTIARARMATGVEVLDEMVAEGMWKGSSTVVFGPPGSGKTLLGLHFLFAGIERGERVSLLTLQENPTQLALVADAFGWDLQQAIADGALRLAYASPVEVQVDEVVNEVVAEAEAYGVQRVVIDSLNDLEAAALDPIRFREFVYALVQQLISKGVTVLFTGEIRDLFATSYFSDAGVSHMADNIIVLHYLRERSRVKRAITVLKTRGSAHETRIREFTIDGEGFHIGEPFDDTTLFPVDR